MHITNISEAKSSLSSLIAQVEKAAARIGGSVLRKIEAMNLPLDAHTLI